MADDAQLQGYLNSAVDIAKKAGEVRITRVSTNTKPIPSFYTRFQVINEAFEKEKSISTKGVMTDLVTETDQRVEKLIIGTLQEEYPTHRQQIMFQLCYFVLDCCLNSSLEHYIGALSLILINFVGL